MSDAIFFAPLRVPLTDERTGLMSREWYLFFQAMFLRIGGAQAFSADDLQLLTDMSDATEDGNDLRTSIANIDRAVALDDEQPSRAAADIAELQALYASIPEDVSPTGAAPTAKVGLTAVAGSARTFMPSDAAPPLDQTIAPTLSANWTWKGDVLGVIFRNTSGTQVGQIGPDKFWTGGADVADLSIGSVGANLNLYSNNSTTFALQLGATVSTFSTDLKTVGKSGFNNTAPIAKPTATGSRAANAALASLLTALASYGLITDSTTV